MNLTCPSCGHSGEVKGSEEFFEVRGQWPDGHWPVRKCRGCGAGLIVKPSLFRAKATVIDAETWELMEARFASVMTRHAAGVYGNGFDARDAAMNPAADRLDEAIEQSPVDDYFKLVLLAYAWGGYQALQVFCNTVDDDQDIDEQPPLNLVKAVEDPGSADGALRAAAWAVVVSEIACRWPERRQEVLVVARAALPVADDDFELLAYLAELVAEGADDADDVGALARFTRETLEYVIGSATGTRPGKGEMLFVLTTWAECFTHGLKSARERLAELEEANPDMIPDSL